MASKMADRCASSEFCSFAKRLFYEKPHVLNQSIAALRRSVGLLGRFVTVWKKAIRTQNTPSYCNPAAHARRGLIVMYVVHIQVLAMLAGVISKYSIEDHADSSFQLASYSY